MLIKSVHISHFRGINEAKIDGFKNLNLFFGKNNCGKSTLLEALFLASGQNNPVLPLRINAMRSYIKVSEEDTHYFFYKADTEKPIVIDVVEDEDRHLEIASFRLQSAVVDLNQPDTSVSSNIPRSQYGLRTSFSRGKEHYQSELRFDLGQQQIMPTVSPDQAYKETINCNFLYPGFDFQSAILGLSMMLQEKEEHILLDALRMLEPSVKDFHYLNGTLYVDIGLRQRIPVNLLGDGVRKMIALVTLVYASRGGVLLVDEISNGFHYSVMKQLWVMLLHAMQKNNTQIFVTTHDIDSIKGLSSALKEVYSKESERETAATMFKMVRDENGFVHTFPYTPAQLSFAVDQEIEVR